MKLFNKGIDTKLFNQFQLGSDLQRQKVVAKIFNPYGRGRWYLLNSDPQDPDYLWAIVQIGYMVEVGSVSRKELETMRIKPWGFPLERDIHFTPINALEVYNGLREGKFYKKGGFVNGTMKSGGMTYMDLSKIPDQVINDSKATKILSDVSKVNEVELVKKSTYKFDNYPVVRHPNDAVTIFRKFWNENSIPVNESMNVMFLNQANAVTGLYHHSIGGINSTVIDPTIIAATAVKALAKGVIIAHNHPSGNLNPSEADIRMTKKIRDGLALLDIQLLDSLIITQDNGSKSLREDGHFERGGMMARGGKTTPYKIYHETFGQTLDEAENYARSLGYEMAKEERFGAYFPDYTNGGVRYGQNVRMSRELTKDGKPTNKKLNVQVYRMDSGRYELNTYVMERGGMMEYGGDVYDEPDAMTAARSKASSDYTREDARQDAIFMVGNDEEYFNNLPKEEQDELMSMAFDEYYKSRWSMASGGIVNMIKEKMAMGGATFSDKVSSVKSSLLKRKKVSPKVQKDYGKTYSPKEAEQSAKRIVGAMTARERMKAKMKK